MEEIWNINPSLIKTHYKNNHEYNYNFLNVLDFNVTPYYKIVKLLLINDIQKLYNFLYIRSVKLNKLFNNFEILEVNKNIDNPIKFNNKINNYINNDKIKSIFILNSIQLYSHY